MSWWEEVTGRSQSETDAYRANKEAVGGRTLNQDTLDRAAAVGALGKDSGGNVVRDASRAGNIDTYLDVIMGESGLTGGNGGNVVNGEVVATIPTTGVPGNVSGQTAPIPQPDPRNRQAANANPDNFTEQDITKLETAMAKGVPWETILGGSLGAGVVIAAKAFMDHMSNQNANVSGLGTDPNSGTRSGIAPGPNSPAPTGTNPFAHMRNATGGSYMDWVMGTEADVAKETPNERMGHVVDGTFREVGTDPQIPHKSASEAMADLRNQLLSNQSRGTEVTNPNARAPRYNEVMEGTFSQLNPNTQNSMVHTTLSPSQIKTIVEATTLAQEGASEQTIRNMIEQANIDLTNESVVDAVRRTIQGHL